MNHSTAVPLARSTILDLLRGMLFRLDDVSSAGQHYVMDKVLPLLRREAFLPAGNVPPSDLAVMNRSLSELEHEAARLAPDPSALREKARRLLDALALVHSGNTACTASKATPKS